MVKKLKEIITEAANRSLSRVHQHTIGRNIGIITAHRGEFDAKTNKERNASLSHDIRKAGYGHVNFRGRYVENHGKSNARHVDEHSFMVVGKKGHDSGNLKSFLTKHGEKYGQDSVLHKSHDSDTAHLIGTKESGFPGKGNTHNLGKFHVNRVPEFHSALKGRRTFAFEEAGDDNGWVEFGFYTPITFSSREERIF